MMTAKENILSTTISNSNSMKETNTSNTFTEISYLIFVSSS